jgi:hypothetical protein
MKPAQTLPPGWKARTQVELALMADLHPLLTKRAGGRDISGLSAYEQSGIVETLSPQLIQRLSFSHLTELIDLPDDTQRRFYDDQETKKAELANDFLDGTEGPL